MKRCPTCLNTFDDSLRFCQLDGTLLVNETGTSSADSMKTIVGDTTIRDDADDLLPLGEDETKALSSPLDSQMGQPPFGAGKSGSSSPFDEFSSTKSDSTSFSNESSFGSSPFGSSSSGSTFDSSSNYQSPSTPFAEPSQQSSYNSNPFNEPANSYGQPLQQSSWSPPPAPEAGWQSQNIGANTPFQPPVTGAQGSDTTLPIIALVCGILSLTCCGPVTGIIALITGFMGKNNADQNPQQYGGRGLALAGMIMGGISIVLTVLYFIFVILIGIGGNL